MKWFLKEQPGMALYDSNGRPIPFIVIDQSYGYLATDNGWLIEQCENAIRNRAGGVIASTEEKVEAIKKAQSSANSSSQHLRFVSSGNLSLFVKDQGAAARPVVDAVKAPFGINPRAVGREEISQEGWPAPASADPTPQPLTVPSLPKVRKNPMV